MTTKRITEESEATNMKSIFAQNCFSLIQADSVEKFLHNCLPSLGEESVLANLSAIAWVGLPTYKDYVRATASTAVITFDSFKIDKSLSLK